MKELVSIIIPVYNRSDLIGQTLDSILMQTWINWECIVVDDGSQDYIKELMQFYCERDERFRFLERPGSIPRGVSSCRNFGFEKSKGDFINWFDSDDIMKKDCLQKKMNLLLSSPNIDFCLCPMQAFRIDQGDFKLIRTTNVQFDKLWEDFVLRKFSAGTPSILWKKNIISKQKLLFDDSLFHSEDLEFYSRIFYNYNRIGVLEEPLIMFRDHESSLSGEFLAGAYLDSFLEVRQRIFELAGGNIKIERYTIFSVLDTFRRCLSLKYYEGCNKCLDFVFRNNRDKRISFRIALIRLQMAYFVFRKTGRGETRFRRLLKIK